MFNQFRLVIALAVLTQCCVDGHADIYRWDTGEVIPGTEGIVPGPGAQLDQLDLQYASLEDFHMEGANFAGSNLTHARFSDARLTGTILTGATITRASFWQTIDQGFTKEQLYSTRSWHEKDLRGIQMGGSSREDLTEWNFRDQNLTDATFSFLTLTDTDFTGATISGANFLFTTQWGFIAEQLYSTGSYEERNLRRIQLSNNDLTGWDFRGQNLANAIFRSSTLASTKLHGADLRNVNFENAKQLSQADFDSSSVYNQWTLFPADFDAGLAELTFALSAAGDFDANEILDQSDVDRLSARIRGDALEPGYWPDAMFDVNFDSIINDEDLSAWIHDHRQSWFGDANLNGEFDNADLVAVLAAGEYENGIDGEAGWASGDWDADGDFTSGDLVIALADGGYEQGPRPAAAVPEPSGIVLVVIAFIGLSAVPRTRRQRP